MNRKATKAKRISPLIILILDIKQLFFREVVKDNNIPFELIVNWDQTGSKFVPVGQWALADEGSTCMWMSLGSDK